MPKSYDIAEISPSDGLPEFARNKINRNFTRLLEISSRENSASFSVDVQAIVDLILPTLEASVFDDVYPVGCVISTNAESDPRLSRGTWKRVGAERYIMAAGGDVAVGSQGGSNSFSIPEGSVPRHSHSVRYKAFSTAKAAAPVEGGQSVDVLSGYVESEGETGMWPEAGGRPIEILPEFYALLFYERIS